MFNIKPFSRLIASAKVAFEGITTPVDRLIACVLVVPISIFLMLSMTPVENRLQTQRVHDKNISALRGEINDLRRLQQSSEEARKEIAEREDKLSKELVEQDSITMQIIWGSELDFGRFRRREREHFACAARYGTEFLYCLGLAGT